MWMVFIYEHFSCWNRFYCLLGHFLENKEWSYFWRRTLASFFHPLLIQSSLWCCNVGSSSHQLETVHFLNAAIITLNSLKPYLWYIPIMPSSLLTRMCVPLLGIQYGLLQDVPDMLGTRLGEQFIPKYHSWDGSLVGSSWCLPLQAYMSRVPPFEAKFYFCYTALWLLLSK